MMRFGTGGDSVKDTLCSGTGRTLVKAMLVDLRGTGGPSGAERVPVFLQLRSGTGGGRSYRSEDVEPGLSATEFVPGMRDITLKDPLEALRCGNSLSLAELT